MEKGYPIVAAFLFEIGLLVSFLLHLSSFVFKKLGAQVKKIDLREFIIAVISAVAIIAIIHIIARKGGASLQELSLAFFLLVGLLVIDVACYFYHKKKNEKAKVG